MEKENKIKKEHTRNGVVKYTPRKNKIKPYHKGAEKNHTRDGAEKRKK